jgi:uncharacterized protein
MTIIPLFWNFRKTWKPKGAKNKENFFEMKNSGLTKEELDNIKAVFTKYKQIEKVVIYGSRAMGNYKPASDIDLALVGKDIDLSLQLEIESELDDLMLPMKFDISIFNKLENPEFISHINRVGKEFYNRESIS